MSLQKCNLCLGTCVTYVVVLFCYLCLGCVPGGRERLVAHGIVLKACGGDMGEGQGGVSGNRTPRSIVGIGAACHAGVAALVGHAGEQVALVLIAERERHVIGFGDRLEQVCAGQIGIAEHLLRPAVNESGGGNASV